MKKYLLSMAAVCGLGALAWAADPPAGSNPPTAPSPSPAATAPAAPTAPTVVTTTTPGRRFGLLARLRERRATRIVYTAPVTAPSTTPSTTVPMPMPKPGDGTSSSNNGKVVPASGSTPTPSADAGTTVVTSERVVPVRRMGLLQRLRLRR